jgi:hypothetical protein
MPQTEYHSEKCKCFVDLNQIRNVKTFSNLLEMSNLFREALLCDNGMFMLDEQ